MGLHQRYATLFKADNGLFAAKIENETEVRQEIHRLFNSMMKALYKQEGASLNIEILASPEAQDFIQGHSEVLNSSFSKVEMSDTMRERFHESNYIFSGMKTFHELNEAFPSLLDSNGERKPFNQFLNDVQKIDKTYNQNYLRTEYNFVNASASMAGRWENFDDSDRYLLEYRTVQDDKVRPEHAELHGVALPKNSPFWDEFFPPNGYNCRCTVVEVLRNKEKETELSEAYERASAALEKDTKQMFRFNPGKEARSVPSYNPYTIKRCRDCDRAKTLAAHLPDNELCAACQIVHKCAEKQNTNRLVDYRKEAINKSEHIEVQCNSLLTKEYYQTKKSLRRAIYHAKSVKEAQLYSEFYTKIKDLRYVRESPLGEGKDMSNPKDLANIQKKRDRGVTSYNVYELVNNGVVWEVKLEVYKNRSETLYYIKKK